MTSNFRFLAYIRVLTHNLNFIFINSEKLFEDVQCTYTAIHKLEMFIAHHKFLLKSARNREHKNFIHKIIRQRSRMVVIDKQNINIGQKVYENDGNNFTTSQY